jgi:multiple sugar transport system permease protein
MALGTRGGATLEVAPDGPAAPGSSRRRGRRFDVLPYALVAPLALFIVALALVPAGVTIVQSFFRVDALNPPTVFNGLENFRNLLSDGAVRASLANTGLYVLIGVVLSTVLGIGMAVTLQHRFLGRSLLIAVLILPWALPGVVEGIVWTGIWDSNIGLLNSVLSSANLIDHYHTPVAWVPCRPPGSSTPAPSSRWRTRCWCR